MHTTKSKIKHKFIFFIIIFRFLMQTWTLELSNISFGNKVETWLYITDYSTGDCISVIGDGPTSFTNTTSGSLYQGFAPVHDLCVEGQGTTFGDVQTWRKFFLNIFFKDTVLSCFVSTHRTKFCCKCGTAWPNVVVKAMQGDVFAPLVTAIIYTPLIKLERYRGMYVHFLVGLSVKVCVL